MLSVSVAINQNKLGP